MTAFNYNDAIEHDATILAELGFTEEQLGNDTDEVWNAFVKAGGDNSHSGASWSCVRACARRIMAEVSK